MTVYPLACENDFEGDLAWFREKGFTNDWSGNVEFMKVPILGDVPLLGSLFRSNATQKRKSELVILVTPKILKDG